MLSWVEQEKKFYNLEARSANEASQFNKGLCYTLIYSTVSTAFISGQWRSQTVWLPSLSTYTTKAYFHITWFLLLTHLLLNTTCPVLANSVDPDQLASEEANWSGSALFAIKYVNL